MISRNFSASFLSAHLESLSTEKAMLLRRFGSAVYTILHHGLMTLGVAAITALCLMFVRPHLADQLKALSPFSNEAAPEGPPLVTAPSLANLMSTTGVGSTHALPQAGNIASGSEAIDKKNTLGTAREQQWVTSWIARRYHVANDASNMLVSSAYTTAQDIKLDPLLILAVMAIESGFNPFAESPMGAQGLMQVMSKVHQDKFNQMGGLKAALNPVANIRVGSLILKDYVTRGGSVQAGLKLYVGAGAFDNDAGYGSRVLAEYNRLKEVASGHNVPTTVTAQASPAQQRARTEETNPANPTATPAESTTESKPENQAVPLAAL